jgi:phage baseplate assembly protein W
MIDLSLTTSGDLALTPSGSLSPISGVDLSQQRVLRRLLTNPGDYIWHPDYGAGLGLMVGRPVDRLAIQTLVTAQMAQEASVCQQPAPVVTVTSNQNGSVYVGIQYTVINTNQTASLNLTLDQAGITY